MAFSHGVPGNQGAIPAFSDVVAILASGNPSVASLASAGTSEVLTGFQIDAGIFVRSGGTTTTATTDTAANIITAMGPGVFVGMTGMLIYVNLSSGTATIAAGTGVTTSGTMTVLTAGLRVFIFTVTNITAPAVTVQGAFALGAGVVA
jgi:hypothetical protein